MKVAIVLPAYNEENNISRVIDGIKRTMSDYDYEIIVVNDCSSDNTAAVAKKKKVTLINHRTNLGYGGALITGFKKAQKANIIATLDSDGQHDPAELISLIEPIRSNEADVVIGSRFLDSKTKFPFYRKMGILFFTGLTNLLFGLNVTDCQSGLRAYKSEVLRNIALKDHGMGISLETLAKITRKGYRITEVPSMCDYSRVHYSKNPISHGASLLKSIFVYYFEK